MNKDLLHELIERALGEIVPELNKAFDNHKKSWDKKDIAQTLINCISSKPKRVSVGFQIDFLRFAWPLADASYKKDCSRRLVMCVEACQDFINYLEGNL